MRGIITSIIGINSGIGIAVNSCHFNNVINTKATTPKEPTRLSFIISSFFSLSRPEKSPSLVSINPSACNPPVNKNSLITIISINGIGDKN